MSDALDQLRLYAESADAACTCGGGGICIQCYRSATYKRWAAEIERLRAERDALNHQLGMLDQYISDHADGDLLVGYRRIQREQSNG